MEFKETFSERLDGTFILIKNNINLILWPIFAYLASYLVFIVVSNMFSRAIYIGPDWYNNQTNATLLISYIAICLAYVLFFVILEIAYIRYLSDIDKEESKTLDHYFSYGLKNLLKSFRTYFHIFVYVYLIPCIFLILILGGVLYVLMNSSELIFTYISFSNNEKIAQSMLYIFIALLSIFFLMVPFIVYFGIYRGIKAKFAIYMAVDKNDFSKNSFNNSVMISKNNWFRVFGNFLVILIIVGIASIIIRSIGSALDVMFGVVPYSFSDKMSGGNFDPSILRLGLIQSLKPSLGGMINMVFGGISAGFTYVFTFLLYRRLLQESGIKLNEEVTDNSFFIGQRNHTGTNL